MHSQNGVFKFRRAGTLDADSAGGQAAGALLRARGVPIGKRDVFGGMQGRTRS